MSPEYTLIGTCLVNPLGRTKGETKTTRSIYENEFDILSLNNLPQCHFETLTRVYTKFLQVPVPNSVGHPRILFLLSKSTHLDLLKRNDIHISLAKNRQLHELPYLK